MKIVEPKAWIIEGELAELSVHQRVDRCASVCYQRPPKPTEEEAVKFCRRMVDDRHGMTLEMAMLHIVVSAEHAKGFACEKYIMVSQFDGGKTCGVTSKMATVTGSIRAFMEAKGTSAGMMRDYFLKHEFPAFFGEPCCSKFDHVRFAEPHEIPWQHQYVAVQVITNRAISHQLVRHRPCAILQESQRYCRYDGKRFEGEVTFIRPLWVVEGLDEDAILKTAMFRTDCVWAEARYMQRLQYGGLSPQQARGVLPNDCKTELVMYASLPEWKHILNTDTMRCSSHADPEMRRIMLPLREEFKEKYPEVGW